ncbi:MAG: ABC transporter substrate-binding protein [Geminicoccaceae bacterium]|nr:ABC transporter substrate-binding protein [Geminicoccaceae bacterium]
MPHVRTTRRGALGLGLAAALAFALPFVPLSAGAADADAEAFVDKIGEKVMDILRDGSLDRAGKLAKLRGLLDESTDLDLVARLVMGPTWRQASPEQQAAYTKAFRQLINKTMADRLGDYGGETFGVTGSREANERDTIVSTQIKRPGGQAPIAVDWRVRNTDGERRIIDIVAEGVSLVVSQRDEVASIVGQKGIDGLIQTMEARAKSDKPIETTQPLKQG